jgi:hypothetical protein
MSSALTLPETPRQPDGVVLDPPMLAPPAVTRARASGVISLKAPIGDDVLRRAVRAFFDVFVDRDADALDALLSRSARLLDAHGGSSYATLREELRSRIRAFDAAGASAVRVDTIERFDYRDLAGDPSGGAPPEMRPGDVLLRVHVAAPSASATRLFAPVVILLLRWEEDAEAPGQPDLRVAGYDEEDGAPRAGARRYLSGSP